MPLIYFIAGMIFIYFIVPLFEGFLAYLLTMFKKLEAKETEKIYKIQQTIKSESDDSKTVIGFVYKEEEEDDNEV